MSLSYEDSGVSLTGADAWVETIRRTLSGQKDDRVLAGVGGFAGLFRVAPGLCLAACTDGVGTKVEIARAAGILRGLGQDLVAMSVNDLVTCGARPLFFLDYMACGRLVPASLAEVLTGIRDACAESDCVLLGGETAEMPGVYPPEGLDLAGFAVGIVEEERILDGSSIRPGDLLLGLPSSGIHSNGYSLVRRALLEGGLGLPLDGEGPEPGSTLAEALLRPTRLYVRSALAAVATGKVKGMAHITGGGLWGNIPRILPEGLRVEIDPASWTRPPVFDLIARAGVEEREMRSVFNLGIGFVLVTAPSDCEAVRTALEAAGETVRTIGTVTGPDVDETAGPRDSIGAGR
jgi:phosphoribosylformylglycinamidine cyclo-ligase